jgi:hypothetical protein
LPRVGALHVKPLRERGQARGPLGSSLRENFRFEFCAVFWKIISHFALALLDLVNPFHLCRTISPQMKRVNRFHAAWVRCGGAGRPTVRFYFNAGIMLHCREPPLRARGRHSSTCDGSGSCTKHFELRGRAGVRGEVFGAIRGREREQPFRLVGVALL